MCTNCSGTRKKKKKHRTVWALLRHQKRQLLHLKRSTPHLPGSQTRSLEKAGGPECFGLGGGGGAGSVQHLSVASIAGTNA